MSSTYSHDVASHWKERTSGYQRALDGVLPRATTKWMQGLAEVPLSRFVERVNWITPSVGRARRVDRLPDGRTALVARVLDGQRGDIHLVGPRTLATLKEAKFQRAWLVQFKPACAAPLLGIPACELTNRYVALEDVWGPDAQALAGDLLSATTARDALHRLGRAFAARQRPTWQPGSTRLVRHAAQLLEHEDQNVERVAVRLGVTARHLRRAFNQSIGVGPKGFARAVRLQRAVTMLNGLNDWGRIAADAGYYDQSHLIADFRALIGLTPGAFAKRLGDTTTR